MQGKKGRIFPFLHLWDHEQKCPLGRNEEVQEEPHSILLFIYIVVKAWQTLLKLNW